MQAPSNKLLLAVLGSLALHALALAFSGNLPAWPFSRKPEVPPAAKQTIILDVVQRPPEPPAKPPHRTPASTQAPAPVIAAHARPEDRAMPHVARHPLATQPAPPAPTPEEWEFAGQYTLKNSKGYRYMWGKQVRSMMGTAVEGPQSGEVRFRLEIAPDGTLARLETLWTTSTAAEQLARQVIESMPPLPPTPTGKPLSFERTISFTPFASDWPPIYDDDCLPDPPAFSNPFAWDGKSPQVYRDEPVPAERPDLKAYEECLKKLPQNSIEAEVAREQRIQNQWGSDKLGK